MDECVTFFIAKKVTMVQPALSHPCATAHQPKSSAPKNSPNHKVIYLRSGFAFKLVRISLSYFLQMIYTNRVLILIEIGFNAAQTVLGHVIVPNSK